MRSRRRNRPCAFWAVDPTRDCGGDACRRPCWAVHDFGTGRHKGVPYGARVGPGRLIRDGTSPSYMVLPCSRAIAPPGRRRSPRGTVREPWRRSPVGVLTWVDTGVLRSPADHPDAPSSGTQPASASPAAEIVAQPYVPPPAQPHATLDSLTLELMPPDAEVSFTESTLPYSPGMRLPAGSYRMLVTRPATCRNGARCTWTGTLDTASRWSRGATLAGPGR